MIPGSLQARVRRSFFSGRCGRLSEVVIEGRGVFPLSRGKVITKAVIPRPAGFLPPHSPSWLSSVPP